MQIVACPLLLTLTSSSRSVQGTAASPTIATCSAATPPASQPHARSYLLRECPETQRVRNSEQHCDALDSQQKQFNCAQPRRNAAAAHKVRRSHRSNRVQGSRMAQREVKQVAPPSDPALRELDPAHHRRCRCCSVLRRRRTLASIISPAERANARGFPPAFLSLVFGSSFPPPVLRGNRTEPRCSGLVTFFTRSASLPLAISLSPQPTPSDQQHTPKGNAFKHHFYTDIDVSVHSPSTLVCSRTATGQDATFVGRLGERAGAGGEGRSSSSGR